ncbi:damage-control phosphatase ARMT1 family protein [Nocardiopsis ansamitocini]|uniref:Damage-control phosphatase ARMT1-like metal-binding domain-containing protein n=1 Tax=Nocardiopsis ansamitocini TaxID=1670832 RepID=A0A9W6UK07_9ACTN|nr:damage-control phosphatase ARMT1 family protein [Nocardiopsis ansamitocini]GLU49247.1 hypothetical protein Nans01_35980 [Nocardiopsis ansamitocini]
MPDATPTPPGPAEIPDDASVITSDVPGSFAWRVMRERNPALVRKVRDAFPFSPERRDRFAALLDQLDVGVVEPIGADAHDHRSWQDWGIARHIGTSLLHAPFLWAESYFYRLLLDASGYFGPGPWRGVDPFAPFKRAELAGPETAAEIRALDTLTGLDPRERADVLLRSSLWGNRADLSFQEGAHGVDAEKSRLVADATERFWNLLDEGSGGRVCLVADNAGRELLPDLVLLDDLLATGRASEVVLHVKPHPYYVSDATTADVLDSLRHLCAREGQAYDVGTRLWRAMEQGRLRVRAHAFSCAPLPYQEMPEDLAADFAAASLTIMKGDLNYRRLVGDRYWAPTTSFATATGYFPGPVAALRTLKSDVVTGLDRATVAALDESGPAWRSSGTHALVQLRG